MCDFPSLNIKVQKMQIQDHLTVKMNKLKPILRKKSFNNKDNNNSLTGSSKNNKPLNNSDFIDNSSETLHNLSETSLNEINDNKEFNSQHELKSVRSVPDFASMDESEYLSIRDIKNDSLSISSLDTIEDNKNFIVKFAKKVSKSLVRFHSKIKNFDAGICNDLTIDMNTMVKILNEDTLIGIANYIKDHDCKNIIVMSGAGISTNAEIPDFRSADRGVYANLEKYNIPYPEAIFELDYFKKNPIPFTKFAKEIYPQNIR